MFKTQRWQELGPYLDRALELSEAEREAWIESVRGENPTLAADLITLLEEARAVDREGFLENAPSVQPSASLAGQTMGAYTLISLIGEGGMGNVWLAQRSDGRFEGHVAIKLLNASLVGRSGAARFEREGHILGRLAHPHIARLLDAGVSAGGQPYLVLEYVEGRRIDLFADERGLPIAERLGLVLQALAAVTHAHANLIVHRDLKPSNILVGADGTVKLLDFGIAKLVAAEGDEEADALTREARAFTPEFAAPEQLRGDAITTATDVYAVGGLLYRLLAGRPPYDLSGASAAEIQRLVCEQQPGRPSQVVEGGAAARQLSGDLDAIVLKALRKEPERRYPSAAALEDDLRRFLDGRPVLARPDRAAYRLRKFVLRHRAGVAVAGVGLALLAGGVIRERTLRRQAEMEADKARVVKDYLVSVFDTSDPFATGTKRAEATARTLLDRGAERVDRELAGQPEMQAEMLGVLSRIYGRLGVIDRAISLQERSLQQCRALYGPRHPALSEALHWLGNQLIPSQLDRAEPLLREALALRRAHFGDRSAETAATLEVLARLLERRNDYQGAERLLREALATRRAVHGSMHPAVARTLNDLGHVLDRANRDDEVEALHREALSIYTHVLGDEHAFTTQALVNLALFKERRLEYAEAESLHRRALAAKRKALGDAHPSVTISLNQLAMVLASGGDRLDEAEALAREALALDRQMHGERHAHVATGLDNLGLIRRLKGDFDGAERLHREALAMSRALYGPEYFGVTFSLRGVGLARQLKGDLPEALRFLRESRDLNCRLSGEKDMTCSHVRNDLGCALRDAGDAAEAESMFRATLSRLDGNYPGQRLEFLAAQVGLGRALTTLGRAAEARPLLEQALAFSREHLGAGSVHTASPLLALGECLAALGDDARAQSLLHEADTVLATRRWPPPLVTRQSEALRSQLRAARTRRVSSSVVSVAPFPAP